LQIKLQKYIRELVENHYKDELWQPHDDYVGVNAIIAFACISGNEKCLQQAQVRVPSFLICRSFSHIFLQIQPITGNTKRIFVIACALRKFNMKRVSADIDEETRQMAELCAQDEGDVIKFDFY